MCEITYIYYIVGTPQRNDSVSSTHRTMCFLDNSLWHISQRQLSGNNSAVCELSWEWEFIDLIQRKLPAWGYSLWKLDKRQHISTYTAEASNVSIPPRGKCFGLIIFQYFQCCIKYDSTNLTVHAYWQFNLCVLMWWMVSSKCTVFKRKNIFQRDFILWKTVTFLTLLKMCSKQTKNCTQKVL